METIGQSLKRERKRQGLSQIELADRLGTSQTSVSRWESHRWPPSIDAARAIAEFLGRDVNDVIVQIANEGDAGALAAVDALRTELRGEIAVVRDHGLTLAAALERIEDALRSRGILGE